MLNPGGTAVLLDASIVCRLSFIPFVARTSLHSIIDPSTPNRFRVQDILHHLERQYLGPYKVAGMGCDLHETLMLLPWTNWHPRDKDSKEGEKTLKCKNDSAVGPVYWYWTGYTTAMQVGTWLAISPMYYDWRVTNPRLIDTSEDLVAKTVGALTECVGGGRFGIGCMIQQYQFKKDG